MKLSFLFGATLPTILRLFIRNRKGFKLQKIPIAFLYLLIGTLNSLLAIPDLFYRKKEIPQKIVFVLGHYRCGTTHLFNLLAADKQLIPPTTYQVIYPRSFLATERLFTPLFNKIAPGKRAMDNVVMRMESPQEEEMAIAAMGGPSPYLTCHFPKRKDDYRNCISFDEADNKTRETWMAMHLKFVRKLASKYGSDKTFLLKSPANTARIPLLLKMYPQAKFVYIHRDPYKTIPSSLHLYKTWYEMEAFHDNTELKNGLTEDVFSVYELINKKWFGDEKLIDPKNKITICFSELQQNPKEEIVRIYQYFELGMLDEELFNAYLKSIAGYEKNSYPPLNSDLKNEISKRANFVCDHFGYHTNLDSL